MIAVTTTSLNICMDMQAVKVGEGTYAEVFKAGGKVLKIMPVGGRKHINGFPPRKPEQVADEVAAQLLLSDLHKGTAATVLLCSAFEVEHWHSCMLPHQEGVQQITGLAYVK
jgi:hypothetical protein